MGAMSILDRARVAGGVLCLGAGAFFAWPVASPEPAQAEEGPTVAIEVMGRADDPSVAARAQAEAAVRTFLDAPFTLRAGERAETRSRRAWGVSVDVDQLAARIDAARDPGAPMHALRDALAMTGTIALDAVLRFDDTAASAFLREAKLAIDANAVSARIDAESLAVTPEREGARLDVVETLARLHAAHRDGASSADATVLTLTPRRTAAQLADVRADVVMGRFRTRYNRSARVANRTHNLRVAARAIDGTVLLPGEVFDYNEVVGERSLANGYRPAPVIAGGEIMDGVGGGACQISGTLHAAAFFAGLPILERQPHSRPSSYIKLGLDAMVSWPNVNFRFRNDRDHPVIIRMSVEEGWVRASVSGPEHTRHVQFVRRIDGVTVYPESTREDASLPTGIRVLAQRGVPGFRVTRYRLVSEPSTGHMTREHSVDVYPPTRQIWRVGTGGPVPADFEAPAGDGHPEYRADEYTVLSQGVGVRGTEEYRFLGRTGGMGWTVREGMPPAELPGASADE